VIIVENDDTSAVNSDSSAMTPEQHESMRTLSNALRGGTV